MCLFRYKKTSVNPYAIIALPKIAAFLGTPFSVDDGIGVAPSCSPAAQDTLASSLGVELPLPLIMQNRSANVFDKEGTTHKQGGLPPICGSMLMSLSTIVIFINMRCLSFASIWGLLKLYKGKLGTVYRGRAA